MFVRPTGNARPDILFSAFLCFRQLFLALWWSLREWWWLDLEGAITRSYDESCGPVKRVFTKATPWWTSELNVLRQVAWRKLWKAGNITQL